MRGPADKALGRTPRGADQFPSPEPVSVVEIADAADHTVPVDALIARDVDVVRVLVGRHFAGLV
ncbi:hypothetical protein ABZZ74_40740 [Streptomyces sp. NPDC006476]|uniref:hypothetical protein n=1 Tax=Streptomyces sp. NPDC006476 TaxID=3157175 RepID=UPI00339DCD63